MKIISNLVIYYMSKIEISLYNYIETVSYIGRKSTWDPMHPQIEIGKYDNFGNFMTEYGSLNFMRNNIYEFDLSDPNLSSTDYLELKDTTDAPYSTGTSISGTNGTDGKFIFEVPSDAPHTVQLSTTRHCK